MMALDNTTRESESEMSQENYLKWEKADKEFHPT
jgi:hypothetical protein